MNPKKTLSTRQEIFINEYLSNGYVAKEAAIKAGYSPDSATSKGSQLLSMDIIKNEIDRRKEELSIKYEITIDDIINEYIEIINYSKSFKNNSGVRIDAKVWLSATESLAKLLGLNAAKKIDVTGNEQIIINYQKPNGRID